MKNLTTYTLPLLLALMPISTYALTVGDTLKTYFNELYPDYLITYEAVDLQFTDVMDYEVQTALEKAVYHGMLPNVAQSIGVNAPITDTTFAAILGRHFGVTIETHNKELTPQSYEKLMDAVRGTYAYELIQSQNTIEATSTSELAKESDFLILEKTYRLLKMQSYYGPSRTDLIYGAAKGMAQNIGDEYGDFYTPEEVIDIQQAITGRYVGIGVYLDLEHETGVRIEGIIPNGPASKYDIQAGDVILAVDDNPVNIHMPADVIDTILGLPETEVTLTLQRGETTIKRTILREVVVIPSVTGSVDGGHYTISFRSFDKNAAESFDAVFRDALSQNTKNIVIDLRNNSGGNLQEVQDILSTFFGRNGAEIHYETRDGFETVNLASGFGTNPYEFEHITFLTNEHTASASELLILTLQTYFPEKITIIGNTTFGKGTIQHLSPIANTYLKYTVARWYVGPAAANVHNGGIVPDIIRDAALSIEELLSGVDGTDS